MKKYLPHVFATILLFTFSLAVAHAQQGGMDTPSTPQGGMNTSGGTSNYNIKIENPLAHGSTLEEFLKTLIDNVVLPIGAVIAVFFFILTGFKFVMAQGNETALKTAKRQFLYTCIGTAVLLGAWAIANVVENTVNQITR